MKNEIAADIPQMDAMELEEIGVRLYGKWGWSVKIAKVLGKDQSTIRRWRCGSPIEAVYAAAIREHDERVGGTARATWGEENENALAALRLVARAQELAFQGAAVSVRVTAAPESIQITLGIGSGQKIMAKIGEGGRFEGLAVMNEAINKIWGTETENKI